MQVHSKKRSKSVSETNQELQLSEDVLANIFFG